MDLQTEILREHSKRHVEKIARWIGADKRRFRQLMGLFLHGDYLLAQRSAWIVNHCAQQYPQLITPWIGAMLDRMQQPGVHVAVPRNTMRIFELIQIPPKHQGRIVTLCFDYLQSPATPIAIQAYSMGILTKMAAREPDLKNEFRAAVELLLPHAGPGVRARARRVFETIAREPHTHQGNSL
ncbi:MAG TPA: hypothetical protein VI758_01365 [Bacteroidota bacterium]